MCDKTKHKSRCKTFSDVFFLLLYGKTVSLFNFLSEGSDDVQLAAEDLSFQLLTSQPAHLHRLGLHQRRPSSSVTGLSTASPYPDRRSSHLNRWASFEYRKKGKLVEKSMSDRQRQVRQWHLTRPANYPLSRRGSKNKTRPISLTPRLSDTKHLVPL